SHENLARYLGAVALEIRLDGVREAGERERVRDVRSTLSDQLRDLPVAVPVPGDQRGERLRLFQGREVLPLEILDQRDLERIVDAAEQRGQAIDPGPLGGAEPSLAGEDLEPVRGAPDDDRLHEPVGLDRGRELVELALVEVLAGLIRVRTDVP